MKVCVFGVGRSGTTALYSLLQKIMADQLGSEPDYVYEPFLWDRQVFNCRYEECKRRFVHIDSLSVDGMYWHQKIPLFVKDPVEYRDHPFIKDLLSPGVGKEHLLMKAIRINGRFEVFPTVEPELKMIFAVRNPVDVVNSVTKKFSFFGEDFHRNDISRFAAEVEDVFAEKPALETLVGRYVQYWLYMNRYVFERLKSFAGNILVMPNEYFVKERHDAVRRLCSFVGLSFSDKYVHESENRIGPVTDEVCLTEKEYGYVRNANETYLAELKALGFKGGLCDDIEKRYSHDSFLKESLTRELGGQTANALRQRRLKERGIPSQALEVKNEKIRKKNMELKKLRDQLAEVKKELREMDAECESLRRSWGYRITKAVSRPFAGPKERKTT